MNGRITLVALTLFVLVITGCSNHSSVDSPSQKTPAQGSKIHEPQATSQDILNGVQLREGIAVAAENLDYLVYPSSEVKIAALNRLGKLDTSGNMNWESGIEENIVLDNWECTWLEHAAAAFEAGDTSEMVRAGVEIQHRADVPGQREEKFPDVDSYLEAVILPLAGGEWGPAKEKYESSCVDYLLISATR